MNFMNCVETFLNHSQLWIAFRKKQLDGGSSYAESKTLVKAAMARKWKSDHPDSDPSDPIHGMTRSQQTIIFRLRTGHNRLRQHMYKRFKVGDSEICPGGQAPQNTEHVL